MEAILIFLTVQGLLGAFDMFYHHELIEKLPWRKTAAKEMLLHGVRNMFYAVVFISFGWFHWHGALAWVFAAIILTEVLITLWDFVEEDRSRKLPATERVTHAILTLNYGAIIALFMPILWQWKGQPSGFFTVNYGFLSWVMTLYALGVFTWGIRDLARGLKLSKPQPVNTFEFPILKKMHQRILVTGATGFIGQRLCQELINQGHEVTVLTRNILKAGDKFTGRVTFIESLEYIHNHEKIDAIINLAGEPVAKRWTAKKRLKIRDSRMQMLYGLTGLMERLEHKPDQFIQASAIGIYGMHATNEYTENSQLQQDGSFAQRICMELEENLQAVTIPTTILRIGLVIEKDGGALRELLIPYDCGAGGAIGDGQQWWSWIHRDDMVGLILHCLNKQVTGVVNATAPQPVPQKEFAKALGKAMHRPALLPMPLLLVKIIFGKMGEDLMANGQKVLPTQTGGYQFQYTNINQAFNAIFRS